MRLGLNPAITEVNGYNVDSAEPVANWLAARIGLAESGQSQSNAGLGLLQFLQHHWEKALSVPDGLGASRSACLFPARDVLHRQVPLLEVPTRTSIRAGWGIYYDAFGEGLERSLSSAIGFSTTVQSGPGQPIGLPTSRFTGFYELPPLSAFPPAPAGGFPQTPAPGLLAQASTLDDQLRAPYTENTNFSIERQFKGGFMLQLAYVNRESHRSLIGEDMATPTNMVDPAFGLSYYQAVAALAPYVYSKAPASSVPNIAFWQDFWPGAAANGLSATQNIYKYAYLAHPGDWTTALLAVDNPISATSAAAAPFSGCNISGLTTAMQLGCSRLGGNTMFNSQFAALVGFRSIANGNYNGLHVTLRKAFTHGVQFDFNYTYSKCEDLGSSPESSGAGSGMIINPFNQNLNKAVCNYDVTHVFSRALPAPKGSSDAPRLLNTCVTS